MTDSSVKGETNRRRVATQMILIRCLTVVGETEEIVSCGHCYWEVDAVKDNLGRCERCARENELLDAWLSVNFGFRRI